MARSWMPIRIVVCGFVHCFLTPSVSENELFAPPATRRFSEILKIHPQTQIGG